MPGARPGLAAAITEALCFSASGILLKPLMDAGWSPAAAVAVTAHTLSIAGSRRLGSPIASFAGLTEVVFAVLLAWAVLGEQPGPRRLAGGARIVAGVVLVRRERPAPVAAGRDDRAASPVHSPRV